MKNEPVILITSVITVVEAVIACAVGFGLNWTGEQVALVTTVVIAIGGLFQTILTRSRVKPI